MFILIMAAGENVYHWMLYPAKVCQLKPTSTDIDDLKVFPFLTQSLLKGLKTKLTLYLSKADGVSTEINLLWWQSHEEELPR